MCTLALYFNVFDDYPIVVAANRDEHYDRPSAPPTRIGQSPAILAGRDLVAGGTWLGVNEHGLLVGILNRRANSEPRESNDFRSRGLLCLDLLGLKSAAHAKAYLEEHQGVIYQPFTLAFADAANAWTAANLDRRIHSAKLNRDLHVFSNTGAHDERSEKSTRAYALFNDVLSHRKGKPANPGDLVLRFAPVLGDHNPGNNSDDPRGAICVHGDLSGTVSSSILLYPRTDKQFLTFYCPGPPCRNSFSASLPLTVR